MPHQYQPFRDEPDSETDERSRSSATTNARCQAGAYGPPRHLSQAEILNGLIYSPASNGVRLTTTDETPNLLTPRTIMLDSSLNSLSRNRLQEASSEIYQSLQPRGSYHIKSASTRRRSRRTTWQVLMGKKLYDNNSSSALSPAQSRFVAKPLRQQNQFQSVVEPNVKSLNPAPRIRNSLWMRFKEKVRRKRNVATCPSVPPSSLLWTDMPQTGVGEHKLSLRQRIFRFSKRKLHLGMNRCRHSFGKLGCNSRREIAGSEYRLLEENYNMLPCHISVT